MDAAMFDRAVKSTRAVVAGTGRDQLDASTPCTEWDVRDLLNHMIGFYEALAAGAAGEVLDTSGEDYTGEDHLAAFDAAASKASRAFAVPGALEKGFAMGWGETPGKSVLGLAIADTAVHGIDLARGTGQEISTDADVAEAVYGMTTGMLEPRGKLPRGTAFAAPVEVPEDAPVRDRMLAYLGRQP